MELRKRTSNLRFRVLPLMFVLLLVLVIGRSFLPILGLSNAPSKPNLVSSTWYNGANDYIKAKDEQRSVNAPLLIYFRTDWCPYCKKLDEDIIPSDEVSEFMKSVVKIRINPEAGPEEKALSDQFGVKGYPSIFIVPAYSEHSTKIYQFQKVGQTFVALSPKELVSACRAASVAEN